MLRIRTRASRQNRASKMGTEISIGRLLLVPTFVLVLFLLTDLGVLWYLLVADIDDRLTQSKLQNAELLIYQLHDTIEDPLASMSSEVPELTRLSAMADDLRRSLSQVVLYNQDILYAMVVGIDGRVLLHSASDEEGRLLSGNVDRWAMKSDSLLVQTLRNESGMIYDISIPFDVGGKKLGVLRVGLSKQSIEGDLAELTGGVLHRHLIAFALALAGTVVVLALIGGSMRRLRRLTEAAEATNRLSLVGTIAAGLGHEIRNTLNAIRINSQMAAEEVDAMPDTENRQEGLRLLTDIGRGVDQLNDLLSNFLQAARPSPLSIGEVDLHALTDTVLRLISGECERRAVQVIPLANDDHLAIHGDPNLIRQALLNLILNAVQAMPEGGVLTVTVCYEAEYHRTSRRVVLAPPRNRPSGGWAMVRVADTGVGISAEDSNRIFEMFYTTKPDGTGLGLAVAHRIVSQHGGAIEIESTEGKGTTMTLWFPVGEGSCGNTRSDGFRS